MNPQNVFYVGKMCTDSVQINKWLKNLPEVSPGSGSHGSDMDGISPLHPYYSRDYRSTSHMRKMCTDSVQINKWFKNLPEMSPGSGSHGSDMDGLSPLHPYYSRYYRSTSQICLKWAQATASMGRIWTAYLLCTRITLETTALRVIGSDPVQLNK